MIMSCSVFECRDSEGRLRLREEQVKNRSTLNRGCSCGNINLGGIFFRPYVVRVAGPGCIQTSIESMENTGKKILLVRIIHVSWFINFLQIHFDQSTVYRGKA